MKENMTFPFFFCLENERDFTLTVVDCEGVAEITQQEKNKL